MVKVNSSLGMEDKKARIGAKVEKTVEALLIQIMGMGMAMATLIISFNIEPK